MTEADARTLASILLDMLSDKDTYVSFSAGDLVVDGRIQLTEAQAEALSRHRG